MANNRIAYAICQSHGIDTKDMTPKQAWRKAMEIGSLQETSEMIREEENRRKNIFANFSAPTIQESTSNNHESNSKLLKDLGISSFERKTIYNTVADYISKHNFEGHTEEDAEVNDTDYSITFSYDENGDYKIKNVVNHQNNIKELLKEKGVEFEESSISNSIYFTYNGQRYRLSDHKRPQGLGYNEEEGVDKNIIIKNGVDRFIELKKILGEDSFNKINKRRMGKATY